MPTYANHYQPSQVRLNVPGNQTGSAQLANKTEPYHGYPCRDCSQTIWVPVTPRGTKRGQPMRHSEAKSSAVSTHKKRCPNRV